MLADPNVIVVAHRTLSPASEVCPIRRTEAPGCENVRSWIARDGCVPAAHEGVTRKHNITSLTADDRFCSREEENIPGHAFHGALNQPCWSRCCGRPENLRPLLRGWAQALFSFAHDFKP